MKVYTTSEVKQYFNDLITILYEKEYFSYEETAKKYVDELLDDIIANLPTKRHKPAPKRFDKYGKGMKYAAFKKNKRTTWYAFFKTYEENGETIYLVRYIANNHIIAQYL
jgi:hypothetical protein